MTLLDPLREKPKYLGIDYGASRIGLAVSDDLMMFAHALDYIPAKPYEDALAKLVFLIIDKKISLVLLGLPKRTDRRFSDIETKVSLFAVDLFKLLYRTLKKDMSLELEEKIKNWTLEDLQNACDLELIFWDERFTTVLAHSYLSAAGLKRKNHKLHVDKLAAQILLQDYMDSLKK